MLTTYDAPIAQQSTAAALTEFLYLFTGTRRRAVDTEMTYSRHYQRSSTEISPPRRAFTTRLRSDTSATNGEGLLRVEGVRRRSKPRDAVDGIEIGVESVQIVQALGVGIRDQGRVDE